MFARPSRLKVNQNASQQLHLFSSDLYLPWLCPALYKDQRHYRSSSTIKSSQQKTRPALPQPKRSDSSSRTDVRWLASATNLDNASPIVDYIPFENKSHVQPPRGLHFPWLGVADTPLPDRPDAGAPLIINDSLTTKPPRFRTVDAISGELHDIVSTMKACLHVGRFQRATSLMQRLNALYKPDASALLAAHNDYIRELAWKIVTGRDQHLLNNLQKWFEVDLRGRGIPPNPSTYAFMIQAALQDISTSRRDRTVRRYLHLAREAGLWDELMNALLTVLNEQDFGRVTRIYTPESLSVSSSPPPDQKSSSAESPNESPDELPEVRPVDHKLPGWRALRQSLSIFSKPAQDTSSEASRGIPEENSERLNKERQLRMEQDIYDSAVERWRSDFEQLKKIGINSALKLNSFGAIMWNWHQALEPAIREEIKLANEAESKTIKRKIDEDRCRYGPFLQYLDPEKLSAITILSCMTIIGVSRTGAQGSPVARTVMKIGEAVQDESIAEHLKSSRGRKLRALPRASGIMRRRVFSTTPSDPSNISAQVPEGHQWSQPIKARIGAVLLSRLLESAKISVSRKDPETGDVIEASHAALLHRYQYVNGRRIGMLSLNSSMYDRLTREPVGASLVQKHLPMLIKPKPWTSFREGGFLTSTEAMVRVQAYEQSRNYCMIAMDNGDMTQISAGLDALSKTPWHINGPVLEVMLEAWNSGQAIGGIAPDNPNIALPLEPAVEDKAAYGAYLREIKRIGTEKASHKSKRCCQNFQLEIARAYLKETFYFPHNVDFRGRAYPIPPLLNYMGADLCRGLLTFGVGKQLGPSGLRWLKVHLANVFGYDKASFEDRVTFVENRLEEIRDSALKPLDGQRWWLQAEDPWQCLAACKDLTNALDSSDPHCYVSKLAIHQDGTCNGLQHYAALGGDSMGARQVNLEPGDRPADIYTGVAELVRDEIAEDARQGHEIAKALDGKVTRKVVKQTVMTNVYGVTFLGAQLQVLKQLKDLYPEFVHTDIINYRSAAFYIAKKIFKALANMFNGAHDIQYWLGDCGGRIATAITPEQMNRIEAARAGSLNEPNEFQKTPTKRPGERGQGDETFSFRQSVIWTSPLKMPVVQPYREQAGEEVVTNLQKISLRNPTVADPVDKRKQLQAFPPNFIHSLDATHMILSALQCKKQGLTFTAVHDSFWTHAADVETMNRTLRDTFITMHSEDIIGRLGAEFAIRYKDCMYLTAVKSSSNVGKKITAWRGPSPKQSRRGKKLQQIQVRELLLERRRLKLLASEKPEERQEGEAIITPYSIFEQSNGEADLAVEEDLEDVALGNVSSARENKLQANEKLEVGDEDNIGGVAGTVVDDETDVPGQSRDTESTVEPATTQSTDPDVKQTTKEVKAAKKAWVGKVWLWRPLTFPPVPKKGEFDVSRIQKSQYFFS